MSVRDARAEASLRRLLTVPGVRATLGVAEGGDFEEAQRAHDAASRLGYSLIDRTDAWLASQRYTHKVISAEYLRQVREGVIAFLEAQPDVARVVRADWSNPEPAHRMSDHDTILRVVYARHDGENLFVQGDLGVIDLRFIGRPLHPED